MLPAFRTVHFAQGFVPVLLLAIEDVNLTVRRKAAIAIANLASVRIVVAPARDESSNNQQSYRGAGILPAAAAAAAAAAAGNKGPLAWLAAASIESLVESCVTHCEDHGDQVSALASTLSKTWK